MTGFIGTVIGVTLAASGQRGASNRPRHAPPTVISRGLSGRLAQRLHREFDLCGVLLVPVERIELPTFGLQNRCSTAELNRLNSV
jgi:hypothetical protein